MAWTENDTFNASVSTTELSVTGGTSTIQTNTTNGSFCIFLDLDALAAGDEFEVRCLEKVISSGTQREVWKASLTTSSEPIYVSPMIPLAHGWDFTLKKISGTDRTIVASIRQY